MTDGARKTVFKDQDDVVNALYRLQGMLGGIQFVLDPLNGGDPDGNRLFTARMICEAMERDIYNLLDAADEPSPVLALTSDPDVLSSLLKNHEANK